MMQAFVEQARSELLPAWEKLLRNVVPEIRVAELKDEALCSWIDVICDLDLAAGSVIHSHRYARFAGQAVVSPMGRDIAKALGMYKPEVKVREEKAHLNVIMCMF